MRKDIRTMKNLAVKLPKNEQRVPRNVTLQDTVFFVQ
jgi:hypothetical protein